VSGEPKTRMTSYWTPATAAKGAWAERRRLAAAMRIVVERLVTSEAPEAELRAAADALERYAERLRSHPRRTKTYGFPETANAGEVRTEGSHFDYSPIVGLSNPLSPPVRLRVEGEQALGEATFGSAYEGPPGHVHGGWIAAAFDEVLGFTQSLTGHPGMTGTLTIRYRRPTPLHTELRFAGRVVRVEGRKIFTTATLHAGDDLCAESDGLFVRVDFSRFAELAAKRTTS
jgi:acyl-coenzyme A thioesterase PaaI-like protein